MSINYTLHNEIGLVITRFTGRPSDEEFVDVYRELLSDPDYRLGANELADVRNAESLDFTAETLREVDALHRDRYAGSRADFRTAILTTRDQPFGIGRMYQAFADEGPENVKVCRTRGDAVDWLGLEPAMLNGLL